MRHDDDTNYWGKLPAMPPRHFIGTAFRKFHVVAGPDPCGDWPERVAEFLADAAQTGVAMVRVECHLGTRFAFDFEAYSAESACSLVTSLLRPVYGLDWWAEVTELSAGVPAEAKAAIWN